MYRFMYSFESFHEHNQCAPTSIRRVYSIYLIPKCINISSFIWNQQISHCQPLESSYVFSEQIYRLARISYKWNHTVNSHFSPSIFTQHYVTETNPWKNAIFALQFQCCLFSNIFSKHSLPEPLIYKK